MYMATKCGTKSTQGIEHLPLKLFLMFLFLFGAGASLHAQSTATLTGTVTDPAGSVVSNATITVINQDTNDKREVKTDKQGLFAFPNLVPGTYSVEAVGTGFAPKELTNVDLHANDSIKLPTFALAIGAVTDTVTVQSEAGQILETTNGQRSALLSYTDIQDLALEGRDTSELLKVLPGVTQQSSNGVASFNPQNVTAGQSAIGQGLNTNGAPNRGGTTLLLDGANIIDPGANFSALVTVNPEMTAEVSVLSTNFGADTPFGPVVVSSISKSGGTKYHGEAYLDTRNAALNANDWLDNHRGIGRGSAAYYYPGGNIGGFVPYTHKKVLFFGGAEFLRQNLGNSNTITAYVPTPEMLKGDFSVGNADNLALCPHGFENTNSPTQGAWCNNISTSGGNAYATIFPDGTSPTIAAGANPFGTVGTNNTPTYTGGIIPSNYLDPNMAALTKLWPTPTYTTSAQIQGLGGGFNYVQPVVATNNGWIYRARVDYNPTDNDKFFISYQQGYSTTLSQSHGCNIYSTPGDCLPYPGGGLFTTTYSKMVTGHYVHIFNATSTNEFVASWVYGSVPNGPPNPSADYRSTIGFNTPTIYNSGSRLAPTYGGVTQGYPGISQADIFEPNGFYLVKKQIPSFSDNFTKVAGIHVFKIGAYMANTDNEQGNMNTNLQGALTVATGRSPNYLAQQGTGGSTTNGYTGSYGTYNPTSAFLMGNLSNYAESASSPLQDLAYQSVAFYVNDTAKVSKKLTVELGFRFDHVGHWYDRQGVGIAVFYPQRVISDYNSGKIEPGFYWHGIDAGVPLSGESNRFLYVSPRFGMAYDVFGKGNTLIRGGWGRYRFPEQYNDASNSLQTAQAVSQFSATSLTGSSSNFQLSQLSQLTPAKCQSQCPTTQSLYGFDSSDNAVPYTESYNLTIDQKLPWKILLDVAYVGNKTQKLSDTGAEITTGGGNTQGGLTNQNKVPLGAFFKPDPITGVTSCNPENLGGPCSPKNTAADYYPYGKTIAGATIYGSSGIFQTEHIDYANYNGLQVSLAKRSEHFSINVNYTFSKALATINNNNPFNNRLNYGVDTGNRPQVLNASYIYRLGNIVHGNFLLGEALNGWTISGISTYQTGTYTAPGINISYNPASIPATAPAGTTTGIGAATYFGTNAGIAIQPLLTCNPTANLAYHQVYQPCYSAPPVGTAGGLALPYVPGPAFIDNDLALSKSFAVRGEQKVQFRISAFNWINHPLPTFSGVTGQTTEYWWVDYQTHAITPNTTASTVANSPVNTAFGRLDFKTGAGPNTQRIIELNVKYSF